nr:translation initiation factor IF-2-like [Gorilla gorilla gorilla]
MVVRAAGRGCAGVRGLSHFASPLLAPRSGRRGGCSNSLLWEAQETAAGRGRCLGNWVQRGATEPRAPLRSARLPRSPPAPQFPTGRPRLRLGLRGLAAGPDQWRAASSRLCAEGRCGQLKGRGVRFPSRSLPARSPAPAPALTPPGPAARRPRPRARQGAWGLPSHRPFTSTSRHPPRRAGPGRAGGGERKPTGAGPPLTRRLRLPPPGLWAQRAQMPGRTPPPAAGTPIAALEPLGRRNGGLHRHLLLPSLRSLPHLLI